MIAVMGRVPDRICPVIMPGSAMMPMLSMLLSVGSNAISSDLFTKGTSISLGSMPAFKSVSILFFSRFMVSLSVLIPMLMPFMALPIIIPAIGMTYCGLNRLVRTMSPTKNATTEKPENASAKKIIILNCLFKCWFFFIMRTVENETMLIR